ncbi:MAG: S41 family peptidase, partial [Flavobacteriales bacterium]
VNPIPGGPSEKLGIQAGDKIVKIEGETVAGIGITNSGVRDRLLGEKGTTVEVGIYRKGEPELLHYEIVRDEIPIRSVEASYMAEPEIGYIKVSRFSNRTMKEFNKALKELKKKGMKDLVLDLQNNGGGYLKTAIKMADHFLGKDRLVVYTEGRAFPRQERRATKKGKFEEGRLVVMVNESSASASEIVSGAVQDWDRGVIVGRRSFGKGLVQRPVDLPDGSVVRLTISRYHTPSGRCIQKPYEKGKRKEYAKEKYKRWETGEVFHMDSIDIADSLRYKTRIKGRTVYGGGGIIPDIFVPLDTTGNSDYLQQLNRKGILNQLALNYADENRNEFKEKYDGAKGYSKNFEVSKKLRDRLVEKAEKEGLKYDQKGYERSERYIKAQLKSMIAQNIWGREAYFRVYNPLKPSYERAIKVLKDGTFEKMDLAETH